MLEPGVDFLNHGSFGATPRVVLAAQRAWRDRMEAEPVRFLARDVETELDAARAELAAFLGADPDDLAFLPNATAGFNSVLRSLALQPGEELLTTDHAYNAAKNALEWVAERTAARVVIATVPFPIRDPDEVVGAGFLWVRRDRQDQVRPFAISHGANSPREDRSRFRLEFDWTGTVDPSAYLSVPNALRFGASLLPGGWAALRARNHELALAARDLIC